MNEENRDDSELCPGHAIYGDSLSLFLALFVAVAHDWHSETDFKNMFVFVVQTHINSIYYTVKIIPSLIPQQMDYLIPIISVVVPLTIF